MPQTMQELIRQYLDAEIEKGYADMQEGRTADLS